MEYTFFLELEKRNDGQCRPRSGIAALRHCKSTHMNGTVRPEKSPF